MNQAEQSNTLSQLITKCQADDGFRQKPLADPAATLKAQGVELPDGVPVKALENTDKVFHLVIPAKPFRWFLCGLLMLAAHAGLANAQTISIGARTGASVKALLGVNVGPGPEGNAGNVDVTDAYQRRGVNQVRTHDFYGPLDMATMYPDRSKDPLLQSSYNFTGSLDGYQRSSDSVFAAIVNGGFEPYFRLGDSYNNVTPPTSSQLNNWVQAAVQVLRHYRLEQWNGYTSNFRFVEIGNEPDNQQFWPSPLTSNDFNKLYDQTAKALRSAFPTLKIGGPGWAPSGCLAPGAQAAVRSLLDYVKTNGSPMDFMSFHVYGSDPATYLGCAQFFRTELDNRGLNSVELHITEWNTSNAAAGTAEALLRHNAQGAAYMTAAWINLQNGGVAQSTFYRGTDPAANSPEFYGMFYGDGRAKKVADAFSLWRDFTAYPRVLQASGVPAGITTMAAENDAGARAVLVANPAATSATITFSFSDGKTLADYRVSVSTVTDSTDGTPLSTPSGTQISIPAKSVVLVRLTPKNNTFDATMSATGTSTASTLAASATLAAADVGAAGYVYVAALAGSNWYVFNGSGWVAWSSGEFPPAFKGNLPASYAATLVTGLDVRGLAGTLMYIGYGTSIDDLLRNSRYKQIYRIP